MANSLRSFSYYAVQFVGDYQCFGRNLQPSYYAVKTEATTVLRTSATSYEITRVVIHNAKKLINCLGNLRFLHIKIHFTLKENTVAFRPIFNGNQTALWPLVSHYTKDQNPDIAANFTPVEAIELNVQVTKTRRSVLTIRVAESPESRHGVLWQVISLPSAVVVRVVHFLLSVEPLVSRHGYTHDDKWNGGGEWG